MKTFNKINFGLFLAACLGTLASGNALAATSSPSVGDIAQTLSFGASLMNNLLWAACIVVGIILLAAAFSQYQMHRANPKISPLGVPVTYLLLALLALSIPFVHYVTGIQKEHHPVKERPRPHYYQHDETDYKTLNDYDD